VPASADEAVSAPTLAGGEQRGRPAVFRLPPSLSSVARARAQLADLLDLWGCGADMAEAAKLVLSELMSNGVLHARTELEVVVALTEEGGLRLEVHDASGMPVVPPRGRFQPPPSLLDELAPGEPPAGSSTLPAATGRGLSMVDALSQAWGWCPGRAGGKVVWAELAGGVPGQVPTGRPSFGRSEHPIRPVRLIAVPLRLLKSSEDHFDDLFRELQMAHMSTAPAPSAQPGAGRPVRGPAGHPQVEMSRLALLAENVKSRLARMREPVRSLIWDAVHRGDRLVDLNLLADAGTPAVLDMSEELLADAARAARSGLLLTEPPPAEVVAWRRWLRREIEDQIAGRPPLACPFPVSPLSGGVDLVGRQKLDKARREALGALRSLLAVLPLDEAGAVPAQAADELVERSLELVVGYVGASRAVVCLLAQDNETMTFGTSVGMSPAVAEYWRNYSLSADLPASEAVRTARPVLYRTYAELDERYPVFLSTPSESDPAIACLPLVPEGSAAAIGCVTLGFPQARDFTPGEVLFLCQLAGEIADFVGRCRQAESRALATARGRELSAAAQAMENGPDEAAVLRELVEAVVANIADGAAAHVVAHDRSAHFLLVRHRDPAREAAAAEYLQRERPASDPAGMVSNCVLSGEPSVIQTVPDEALTAGATDEEALQLLRRVAPGPVGFLPVKAGGDVVAVLSVTKDAGSFLTDDDMAALQGLSAEAGAVLARLRAEAGRDRLPTPNCRA
jgi:serine/threonine-protein kinase RsbW